MENSTLRRIATLLAAAAMPAGKRILVPVLELERCGPGQGIEW